MAAIAGVRLIKSDLDEVLHAGFSSEETKLAYSKFLWKEFSVRRLCNSVLTDANNVYGSMLVRSYDDALALRLNVGRVAVTATLLEREINKLTILADHFKTQFEADHGYDSNGAQISIGDRMRYLQGVCQAVSRLVSAYNDIQDNVTAMNKFATDHFLE